MSQTTPADTRPAVGGGSAHADGTPTAQAGAAQAGAAQAAANPVSSLQAFTAVAQIATALLLIALFVAFLVVLYVQRDDPHWDRAIFLLSGLEAVVFAGAGALFGTSVQHGTVQAARQDAATAKADAAEAKTLADQTRSAAEAGRALYHVVREKAAVVAGTEATLAAPGQAGRPRERDGQPADPHLAELDAIARALFEDR